MRRQFAAVVVAVVALGSALRTRCRFLVVPLSVAVLSVISTGCMDSFTDAEAARSEFVAEVGPAVRERFESLTHLELYAISVSCFATVPAATDADREIARACETSLGLFSDVVTVEDVCDGAIQPSPGAELCG